MNKARRKQLERALGALSDARSLIEEMKDEEQEAFDNMPESIQTSDRGETMEEIIYKLEDIVSSLEDAEGTLEEIVYE